MKIDRLLSIIIILLNKGKISARELSDRFEVSVRTVYRDIDTINMAGIPVVSQQGNTGGFSILDNFKIDRQLLSFQDLVSIISALKGVNNAFNDKKIQNTLEKMTNLIPDNKKQEFLQKNNEIIFDIFPLYCSRKIQENCRIIYDMIQSKKIICITYINQKNEMVKRDIEPMNLIFKGYAWYLFAFCRLKGDYRLFKVSRIKEIELKKEFFIKKSANYQDYIDMDTGNRGKVKFVLKFSAKIKNRILEYFPDEEVRYQDDGSLIAAINCPEDEWIYSFILSFGEDAEIIEPDYVKKIIAEKAEKILKIYKPDIMLS